LALCLFRARAPTQLFACSRPCPTTIASRCPTTRTPLAQLFFHLTFSSKPSCVPLFLASTRLSVTLTLSFAINTPYAPATRGKLSHATIQLFQREKSIRRHCNHASIAWSSAAASPRYRTAKPSLRCPPVATVTALLIRRRLTSSFDRLSRLHYRYNNSGRLKRLLLLTDSSQPQAGPVADSLNLTQPSAYPSTRL
jgi:hypothetical protein